MSWTQANTGMGSNLNVLSLAFTPGAPATLYAGLNGAGVYKSTDGGISWSSSGLSGTVAAIAVDPAAPATVYAATYSGMYKSSNAGASWAPASTGISGTIVSSVVAAGGALYAVEANSGVYKSTDSGASWFASGSGLPTNGLRKVVPDPLSSVLYAQAYDSTFRSSDGGATWSLVASGTVAVAIDPTRSETVYLGGGSTLVRRSLTALATTVGFADGLPASSDAVLAVDRGGATVYLGTYGRGLWRVSN